MVFIACGAFEKDVFAGLKGGSASARFWFLDLEVVVVAADMCVACSALEYT